MLCRVLTDLGAKYDIAVEAPQHTSKGPAEPGNASRGRGASSMNNGGRLPQPPLLSAWTRIAAAARCPLPGPDPFRQTRGHVVTPGRRACGKSESTVRNWCHAH